MKERKQNSYDIEDLDQELAKLPDESRPRPQKRKPQEQGQRSRQGESRARKAQSSPAKREQRKSQEESQPTEKPQKEGKWFRWLEKKKKPTNKEFARVTYIFVTLFLAMAAYLVYFQVIKSKDVINSPYNIRQDLMAERVTRGKITDANGETLAQTVVAEDGSETREYPYNDLFSHVVGYADKGKYGLESAQNFHLLSSNAFFLEKVFRQFQGEKNMGDTVVTTLDARLQQAAYDALGNNKGAVVAMEPSTGKILVMLSKPTFNANTVSVDWAALNSDQDSALLNRATLGQYTPGSTFKLVTALEYMRENPNYGEYGFDCNGAYSADGATIHCYNGSVHGYEDLAASVANSCNASFSNIGLSLKKSEWKKTAKDLLFNKELPCDLSYRQSKFNLSSDSTTAETMMTAIGQGTTQVSPYHMAMITSAIANGGKLMKPYLVSEITNYTGASVKKYMPESYAQLMTSAEAAQLTSFMTDVVTYGTGTALSGQSYTAAGKTGTAEVSADKQMVHSWFVGFSNVENPDLVVSVVVENADTSSITGTWVAKQIFNAYYN